LRRVAFALLLLIAAPVTAFLLYGFTLTYGFDYDDYHFVRPYTRAEVAAAFHGPWDAAGIERPYYRPLTILFFALRFDILGINSTAHHALSLALFALAAALAGWLVFRLTNSIPFGVLGMCFFVAHPGTPYSLIAWVTNQMHLIECVVVLAALAWWDLVRRRAAVWWMPLLGFAAAAFLMKEDGIMLLPAVVVLHIIRCWLSDDEGAAAKHQPRDASREPRIASHKALPPFGFLAAAVVLAAGLLGTRAWALADIPTTRHPPLDVALNNYIRGLYGLFRLVPADRPWQVGASWFVTLVPLAALTLSRRSDLGPRVTAVSGLAIAMLFDLPFIFITKAEQLHFVALGAAVFLTGACAIVLTGLRVRAAQYIFGLGSLGGLVLLALVSRDIARDFDPYGPVVLAHDEIVQTWAAVPVDLRRFVARKRESGAKSTLSPDPSVALDLATFGAHGPERTPDGINYQWMAGTRTDILVTERARTITIPLRHAVEVFREPAHVRVTVDGRVVDDLVLSTPEWRVSQTGLRGGDISPLRRMHRVVIVIDRAWRPMAIIPGSQDGRTLGLQIGEVQLR
jgi:hypothetical protein